MTISRPVASAPRLTSARQRGCRPRSRRRAGGGKGAAKTSGGNGTALGDTLPAQGSGDTPCPNGGLLVRSARIECNFLHEHPSIGHRVARRPCTRFRGWVTEGPQPLSSRRCAAAGGRPTIARASEGGHCPSTRLVLVLGDLPTGCVTAVRRAGATGVELGVVVGLLRSPGLMPIRTSIRRASRAKLTRGGVSPQARVCHHLEEVTDGGPFVHLLRASPRSGGPLPTLPG